jgi:hypothetical protein
MSLVHLYYIKILEDPDTILGGSYGARYFAMFLAKNRTLRWSANLAPCFRSPMKNVIQSGRCEAKDPVEVTRTFYLQLLPIATS